MSFYYDEKKGGVFSPDNFLMPHPGRISRRQALLDVLNGKDKTNALVPPPRMGSILNLAAAQAFFPMSSVI